MSRLPTYNHSLCIQLEKFFFIMVVTSWRPCPGTGKLNVGQLHVLVTGPREASHWLWMWTFKNIYFNILSVLVLVPGLLWTSRNSSTGSSMKMRLHSSESSIEFLCYIIENIQSEYYLNLKTKRGYTGHKNKYFSLRSYFPVNIFKSGILSVYSLQVYRSISKEVLCWFKMYNKMWMRNSYYNWRANCALYRYNSKSVITTEERIRPIPD